MDGHEDVSGRALRAELRRLAERILQMDAGGRLPEDAPQLLRVLGEVRSRIVAYEACSAREPETPAPEPPGVQESRRIVDEAVERSREAEREWLRQWEFPGDSSGL